MEDLDSVEDAVAVAADLVSVGDAAAVDDLDSEDRQVNDGF